MAAITHFYFIPKETTDAEVDAAFTQEFMHIHFGEEALVPGTLLIRKMKYTGIKFDPNGEDLYQILQDCADDPVLKAAIEKFMNDV
jgi:hypothetical protein